jgi:hypothetical protein
MAYSFTANRTCRLIQNISGYTSLPAPFRISDIEASVFGFSPTVLWPQKGLFLPAPSDRLVWVIGGTIAAIRKCHFVDHNPHINYPGIRPGSSQWEASD